MGPGLDLGVGWFMEGSIRLTQLDAFWKGYVVYGWWRGWIWSYILPLCNICSLCYEFVSAKMFCSSEKSKISENSLSSKRILP